MKRFVNWYKQEKNRVDENRENYESQIREQNRRTKTKTSIATTQETRKKTTKKKI